MILKIPLFIKPLVSIIIHSHNNFRYTYNCISSILNAEPLVPYEIIIGNDMSIDNTRIIGQYFTNIIVYNNNNKYNFLIYCNEMVKLSRGKYILFLNNETKVHKEWLIYLIKLIESDEKIGMVGSKLIYPNGKLQEAGGIVWNNGECYNYGRGNNSDMPEYNYVKEVDYISGISILIRKYIWEKIGGFDKRYIPAYYEDKDFAFEIRRLGYKVMYQPKSVVEHYEGISNGKILSSGIQKYQIRNKKKFFKKWKSELKYQKEQGNTFQSRDKGYNRIFVIDNDIPSFNKNAGYRCTFMYLNIFKEIGLQVTFLPYNFKKIEPYTSILQQKGIEVIYGDWYKKNIKNWLKTNLKYFKYVYLERPKIAITYYSLIRQHFSGKIFYFAHDLHYIRLYRHYNITHDKKKLRQSEISKKIEMKIFSNVDIIHVVGNYEYQILKEKFHKKIIRNIPLYIYDNQLTNIEKDFSKRNGLIFVGGFSSSPNKDAVLWFSKYIYPKILNRFPDMVWHIVGSHLPNNIRKLESKNIKIEGFLSDEDLSSLYQKCRIAIVPLRYGAGVKGKIVEAAYNQIPIVTTSIGGEGLDNSFGTFIIEDEPEKMSEAIIKLYLDYSKLRKMSDSGKKFIEKYFSINRAKEVLLMDMKYYHNF
jgi:GT2 family glycosyltransferase